MWRFPRAPEQRGTESERHLQYTRLNVVSIRKDMQLSRGMYVAHAAKRSVTGRRARVDSEPDEILALRFIL
jgi:hypothetical protein